uniref:rRNA N-glycosylase n=1 Tax=Leersia perrieri TaxID=77586 RepID=A0A0D9VW48_9ORYZ
MDLYSSFHAEFHLYATRLSEFRYGTLNVLVNQTNSIEDIDWILPNLTGRKGTITLAFRADNLYLVGFRNKYGQWYCFIGREDLIPGCTVLVIEERYGAKGMGGLKDVVAELLLSRDHTLDAIDDLYECHPTTIPKDVLQRAMGTLLLVIPEPARFTEVFEAISADWESKEGIRLKDKINMKMLYHWGDLSAIAMLGLENDKATPYINKLKTDKIKKINGNDDLMGRLRVLLMVNSVREYDLPGLERIREPHS